MEHYVTLFDHGFLPQGLALYQSLKRHGGTFKLWVLCLDSESHQALSALALSEVALIRLTDVETGPLRVAASNRTRREYCWTLTPFAPSFVFDAAPEVGRVTYLDADTWLCANPHELFAELESSRKAVLITRHAFSPEYDRATKAGDFCVQFVTFVREQSEPVRKRWADQCLDWCYSRVENGRFGDQMYLNDWPTRFGDLVHVLQKQSLTQAPWNSTRYPPSEAALYHFHGLRTLRGNRILLTEGYDLFRSTVEAIYKPYLSDIRTGIGWLTAANIKVKPQLDGSILKIRIGTMLRSVAVWFRVRNWGLVARLK